MKFPSDSSEECFSIYAVENIINNVACEQFKSSQTNDTVEAMLLTEAIRENEEFKEKTYEALDMSNIPKVQGKSSFEVPLLLELKSLPSHLKYV